jgi:hypothetical protein
MRFLLTRIRVPGTGADLPDASLVVARVMIGEFPELKMTLRASGCLGGVCSWQSIRGKII